MIFFLELRIPVALWCFGVKDRVQQVLRVLWDFNFLSLFFSPLLLFFNLLSSSPIFLRFLFLIESISFFFLYTNVPMERKTVYNGSDEWSKELVSFFSLFLVSSFYLPLLVSLGGSRGITVFKVISQRAYAFRTKSRLRVKFNKPWISRNNYS